MFKIEFVSEPETFTAWMSRNQALEWLKSRNFDGMLQASTGTTTKLEDLDDQRLAQALSRATLELLQEMADRTTILNIRNEPDGGSPSWVSIYANRVGSVRVTHETPTVQTADEEPERQIEPAQPFSIGASQWSWLERQT